MGFPARGRASLSMVIGEMSIGALERVTVLTSDLPSVLQVERNNDDIQPFSHACFFTTLVNSRYDYVELLHMVKHARYWYYLLNKFESMFLVLPWNKSLRDTLLPIAAPSSARFPDPTVFILVPGLNRTSAADPRPPGTLGL